eukprot:Nitzschia sp. Nitz4//scaffold24_size164493//57122//58691//NITZ4_002320-RA/size164493-snap-gene-0.3-mRNA-1//1//CDS//3329544090//707//frame0
MPAHHSEGTPILSEPPQVTRRLDPSLHHTNWSCRHSHSCGVRSDTHIMFHGDPFAPEQPVDTMGLYNTLGVDKTADEKEIKKAYRKLAVVHHPDKGGDEHKFKEINAAYEILSDPEKRAKYDARGMKGLEGDDLPSDVNDIFGNMFFGNRRGGGGGGNAPRRGQDVDHILKVTLEDLYNGKTIKLAVSRQILVGESQRCSTCNGQGVVVELRQIAMGMVQQLQRTCQACEGTGYFVQRKREREVLEVFIEKGMKNNEKVVFRNKADEQPNMEAGNLNFIVRETEHPVFKRKGNDLLMTKTLSLNEALCGFEWAFRHLDQREIVVQSRPGEVIRTLGNNQRPFVKIIRGEGMPSRGNPFIKGDLYVQFTIEFPNDGELQPDQVEVLRKILPGPSMTTACDPNTAEIAHLDAADAQDFGKGGTQASSQAYDSDNDEGGPQQVQCQQS